MHRVRAVTSGTRIVGTFGLVDVPRSQADSDRFRNDFYKWEDLGDHDKVPVAAVGEGALESGSNNGRGTQAQPACEESHSH